MLRLFSLEKKKAEGGYDQGLYQMKVMYKLSEELLLSKSCNTRMRKHFVKLVGDHLKDTK